MMVELLLLGQTKILFCFLLFMGSFHPWVYLWGWFVCLEKLSWELKINGTLVEEKESTKYLGTFIDNKLKWNVQMEHIKTKLARNIGLISKIRYYAKDVCLNLYHSLVQSHCGA